MDQEYFESFYPDTARFDEIQKITDFIKEGKSCQLLGIPGVGRSTVLSFLEHNKAIRLKHLGAGAEDTTHFVTANFSEIRNRPLFDVMKYLFLNLTESLRERGMLEENKAVGDTFREHLSFHDEFLLFQGFKEAVDYMALNRKITIIFLFDRFEEYVPAISTEFFTNLRTLRNRAKYRFNVVFSVNRPLETSLEPALLADFYEFVAGNMVYMKLLDLDTLKFRISQTEKITGKNLSESDFQKIIDLTGGHAKLSKLAAEVFLANGGGAGDPGELLLSQKSIQGGLLEIWFSLTPAEQADILEENFEDKDVTEYLEDVGLIKDKKIQIPLLSLYAKSKLSSLPKEKQAIVYDENTNTINKGDDMLSDQLTSSEFRLLRYLLQNQERVIERDEIIGVVWQGVKSTAGITDQAVDQLIFRLRRKIEEDANNPAHLQTVKGRGFRFIP